MYSHHHLYVRIYVCIPFIFGLHVALPNLQSNNVKILPVGYLSETVQLSVLFPNSLLHVYFAQSFTVQFQTIGGGAVLINGGEGGGVRQII